MDLAIWNAQYPVGTAVRYFPRLSSTESKLTKTRSAAWMLPCDEAVVMVEGIAGGVSLGHVQIVASDKQGQPELFTESEVAN